MVPIENLRALPRHGSFYTILRIMLNGLDIIDDNTQAEGREHLRMSDLMTEYFIHEWQTGRPQGWTSALVGWILFLTNMA